MLAFEATVAAGFSGHFDYMIEIPWDLPCEARGVVGHTEVAEIHDHGRAHPPLAMGCLLAPDHHRVRQDNVDAPPRGVVRPAALDPVRVPTARVRAHQEQTLAADRRPVC